MSLEGTKTVAEGAQELARLLDEVSSAKLNWNEAETRFHIIDRLIVDCLGWPRAETRPEGYERKDYTDYELGQPRRAIWEAKRIGRTFDFPANPKRRLVVDLPSVMSTSPEAKEAIQQAQAYCSRRGVEIAVVTNGSQIIAFLGARNDGIPPLDGKCLVIDGHAQLREQFPKVWQALSPQGVAEQKLKQLLRLGDQPKVPAKISTQISGYPCFRTPTSVQEDLQLIADLLLIHVPEWPESEQRFFAQCYCKDWTLSRDSLITKQIIDARYAALFAESEQAPSVIPIKKKRLKGIFADELLAEAVSQRPIVLLGDVGVGKTAFLKNLMLVEAAPEFEGAICVYLDLGSQGALADDLRRFVLKQLDHQLWDKYSIDVQDNAFVQTLYAADLARFEQGIFSALRDNNPTLLAQKTVEFLAEKLRMRDEHLRTALVQIASTTNRQIIIVLDNSDQRTSDVQIETFAIAQELAKSWAALVFIAMRPETYLHLRQATTTAAEAQRVFTIAPPRIEEVIRLRLRFALEIAEGRLEIKRLQSVTLKLGNFAAIVSGLLSGLRNLSTFFDNFCNGNVANAVQVVHNFIGSPNVNTRRIIDRGRWTVSLSDLWPSVLLGRFFYYDPAKTGVLNVFDVWSSNSVDHFLLPMILGYLQYDGPHRSVDGFVAGNHILREMQDWSFSTAAIEWALERASGKEMQLIQRSAYKPDHSAAPDRFRITATGAYYLSVWVAEYSYLDAMWSDTPVFDNATRTFLADRAEDFDLRTRYERAVAFRGYLTEVWNGSELRPAYFNWTTQVSRGQKNFDSLLGFIEQ